MKRDLLKQLISYVKPYYKVQMLGFLFTILYSVTVFLTPLISKYLIDEVIVSESTDKIAAGIGLFCLVCLAQPITSFVKDYIFVRMGEKAASDIRLRMHKGILFAPLKKLQAFSSGEIISRISQDGYMASRLITELLTGIIKNLLICSMIAVGLLMLSPILALSSMALFLLSIRITGRMSAAFERIQADVQEKHDKLCSDVGEHVKAISQIKSYSLENELSHEFAQLLKDVETVNSKALVQSAKIQNVSNAIMVVILCLLYGGGSLMVLYGEMTIGTVIGMGLYFQLLMQPVYELMHQKAAIHKAVPILERIETFENMGTEMESHSDVPSVHELFLQGITASVGITMENLSFSYGDSKVLSRLNYSLPEKGLVVIEGVSGSGKSTLLKILAGLYAPETGCIYTESTLQKHTLSPNMLRKVTAYVEQQPEHYDYISDRIRTGKSSLSIDDEGALSAIENSFLVSSDDSRHSGGEMQRQSLVDAIYKNTPVLLLDEPLSALDEENKALVLKHIEILSNEKLIVVAAHSKRWRQLADRVLELKPNSGLRIIKTDRHTEIS